MSKEAMKLALETSEGIVNADWRKWDELASSAEFERWAKSRANFMATILREALAEQPAQQEPVAWMFEDDEDNGHKTFRQTPPSPEAVAYLAKWNRPAWVPLYTSPPAQQNIRNATLEEIAAKIGKMPFGDTAASFAVWIREQKT